MKTGLALILALCVVAALPRFEAKPDVLSSRKLKEFRPAEGNEIKTELAREEVSHHSVSGLKSRGLSWTSASASGSSSATSSGDGSASSSSNASGSATASPATADASAETTAESSGDGTAEATASASGSSGR